MGERRIEEGVLGGGSVSREGECEVSVVNRCLVVGVKGVEGEVRSWCGEEERGVEV